MAQQNSFCTTDHNYMLHGNLAAMTMMMLSLKRNFEGTTLTRRQLLNSEWVREKVSSTFFISLSVSSSDRITIEHTLQKIAWLPSAFSSFFPPSIQPDGAVMPCVGYTHSSSMNVHALRTLCTCVWLRGASLAKSFRKTGSNNELYETLVLSLLLLLLVVVLLRM